DEWRQIVGSLAVDTDDGLVLIDPLDPAPELHAPRHVLITVYWHGRSTKDLDAKQVWAPTRSAQPLRNRGIGVTDVLRSADDLPGGDRAFPAARAPEVLYWLPEQRALPLRDVLAASPLR